MLFFLAHPHDFIVIEVFNGQNGLSYSHILASVKTNFQLNHIVYDYSYFTCIFIHEKKLNELVTV